MAIFGNKHKEELELGFGSKNYKGSVRFLNNGGSVNVKRTGMGWINNTDIYHSLISASLYKLIFIIISSYILINLIFAGVYYLIGANHFGGLDVEGGSEFQKFIGLFFLAPKPLQHWVTVTFTP